MANSRQIVTADSDAPGVVLVVGTLVDSATPLPGGVGFYKQVVALGGSPGSVPAPTAADQIPVSTAPGVWSVFISTAFGRNLVSAATAGAAETILGFLAKTGGTLTGPVTINDPALFGINLKVSANQGYQQINSTDTAQGSYLILSSNGVLIGSFQAGGTTMPAPYGTQMRIRAYRPTGGLDFCVAGLNATCARLDPSSNLMVNGGIRAGKTIGFATAETFVPVFGANEFYGAAQLPTAGVRGTLAVCDTTAQAIGQGGRITFGGVYSGTTVTTAGSIGATKKSGVAGEYGFGFDIWTRPNGGSLTRRVLVDADGVATITVGLEVSDLVADKPVQATAAGRLTTANGASYSAIVTKAFADSPYAVVAADSTVLCNAVGGAMTVNLPAAATSEGRILRVKKIDASANTVTIDGNAAETIDGAATQVLAAQYAWIVIQCDRANWHIVG